MDVQGGRARTRARITRLVRAAAMLVALAGVGLMSVPASSPRAAGAATTPFALGPLMSGRSAPMTLAPLRGTSEAFSGAAVANGLLPGGGTQIAVGAMNGCVLIYQLADLSHAPVCINTGAGPVQATPVLTDLDHDGYTDMVTANASTGWVLAYRGSANGLAKTPFFSQNTTVNARGPGVFGTPAVGDLDGDGNLEIVVGSLNHDVFAWHLNGALLPGFPRFLYDTLWSSPALRDLNGDGRPEIIMGGDMDKYPGAPYPYGGLLWVLRSNASNYPGFPRTINGEVVWSSPAVGDVDANGSPDIVFGTGLNFPDTHHDVYALNSSGYALSGWSASGVPGVNLGSRVMASPALGHLVTGDPRLYTAVVTSDGYTVVLNPDGTKRWLHCDDWTGRCPAGGQHHGSAVIADVNGDGQQDVVSFPGKHLRVFNGATGAVEAESGEVDPCCQIRTFAPASAPTVARIGTDTWIIQHALYDTNGDGARDNGDQDRIMAWKISSPTAGQFDWPMFKQNLRRTSTVIDTTPPTANASVPASSASTLVTMSWTGTDPIVAGQQTSNVRAFDVDVRDNGGAWIRWLTGVGPTSRAGNTASGSAPFYGLAGHTYGVRVRARDTAGNTGAFSAQVSVAITAGATRAQPFVSAYAVGRNGDVATLSSPPVAGTPVPTASARAIAAIPGGGYVADAQGRVYNFGAAPSLGATPTWPADLTRGIAINPDGSNSGYVLDGYGGLHPVGGAKTVVGSAYWKGWNIARGIALLPTSTKNAPAGYVVDGWGSIHPFGAAPAVPVSAYWKGWDIARGIVTDPDGPGGYVLDGWGGIHPFGGAPTVAGSVFWSGWDIARGIAMVKGPGAAGYILDGLGGTHPFGAAPTLASSRYWGTNIGRGIAIAP